MSSRPNMPYRPRLCSHDVSKTDIARQAPDTQHQALYIPDTCFVCVDNALDDDTPANMALQLHMNVSLNRPPDHTTHARVEAWCDCGHGGGATTWQMPDAVLNCPMDYATILTSIHDRQYIDRVGVMARERSGSSVDQNSVTIQRTTDTDGRDTVLHTRRWDWDADRE